MILLGHERQCFSRTNKRSARRRPPASLRRIVSDRDLAYLIRTLLRFSMQQERGLSSPTSSAAASREKPGSAQSAPTLPAAGCHRRIGCTPRREGSGPPPSDVPRQRQSRQAPPAGTSRKPYPRCHASGSSDRTVRLWGVATHLALTRPRRHRFASKLLARPCQSDC